ncbi:MAG TPA: nucleoside triphosphate pyrophosphohydrolase [Nannocystis exedens]|nr:nucleoside triphosphate pyrophosphohydrolase [Nannocystis exedens]
MRDGLNGLRDLVDRLLADDGCPWDRAQTLESLRPYVIEEAYEVAESLGDPEEHCRELGDLLFQIVFQAALREREHAFDLDAVIEAIRSKMIRRHPHVFADAKGGSSPAEVERQWAQIKEAERAAKRSEGGPAEPLAGVPRALPALQRSWRLQNKAAAIGFDWPDPSGPRSKILEEWAELEETVAQGQRDRMLEEYGDLLFVLVRYGSKLGLSAEDALRGANTKFEARFAHMMRRAHEEGIDPAAAGLEQLDSWWNEARARGVGGANDPATSSQPGT